MSARIVFVPPLPELVAIAHDLVPAGFDLVVVPRFDDPGLGAALAGADYVICYPGPALTAHLYRDGPKVKLVQLLSAGYDGIDLEAARSARVPIANNGGANATAVAEHTLMMMLAVSRRLIQQHANVAGGRWRGNNPPRIYEIAGKTLGIVGLGTIGKKTARLARAFGMPVQYYDIARLTEDAEDALDVRFRLLGELLKSSDIVSLHVPLNATTRHMIGAAELALMKPGAILINTARGPVVDEAALYQALNGGKLLGAGIDVFEREPPDPDNPLLKLDNVLLTAHFAGPAWDNWLVRLRNAFDNVQRVHRGQKPLWVVPELAELVV